MINFLNFLISENILVFAPDFSKVKLTDFGLTRKAGTLGN